MFIKHMLWGYPYATCPLLIPIRHTYKHIHTQHRSIWPLNLDSLKNHYEPLSHSSDYGCCVPVVLLSHSQNYWCWISYSSVSLPCLFYTIMSFKKARGAGITTELVTDKSLSLMKYRRLWTGHGLPLALPAASLPYVPLSTHSALFLTHWEFSTSMSLYMLFPYL